ncbi:MAG TPA: hypothetical protein VHG93_07665 [Longimicrobium sp.]|nr:hypothetical protein [Longimicrobium sp.]
MAPLVQKEQSPEELRKHVTATYFTLRTGIAVIAAFLPLVLWLGGLIRFRLPLQSSMSAYYNTDMRDVFVGVLCATGAFLYLYKGFGDRENLALNAAGVFAVLTALIPPGGVKLEPFMLTPHGAAGVLFFVAIGYVCIFRASDTLPLMKDRGAAEMYSRAYKLFGWAMIASPVAAWLLNVLWRSGSPTGAYVFFVELLGVWTFAAYWILKSRELAQTDAEHLVAAGAVETDVSGNVCRAAAPVPAVGGSAPVGALDPQV